MRTRQKKMEEDKTGGDISEKEGTKEKTDEAMTGDKTQEETGKKKDKDKQKNTGKRGQRDRHTIGRGQYRTKHSKALEDIDQNRKGHDLSKETEQKESMCAAMIIFRVS